MKAQAAHGISFTDKDVVNPDNYIPDGEYNPHKVRPWLIHDRGFTVGVVFADCLQDALDELANSGKLDFCLVSDEDLKDYGEDEDGIARLGDASEPFDIQTLDMLELENPRFSFVALYNARKEAKE